jgi:hypothetical protein
MRISVTLILITLTLPVSAQLTIGAGSEVVVKGDLTVNSSITSNSRVADFTNASVILSGTIQSLNANFPLTLKRLTINGGGVKTLEGQWTVSEKLTLESGIIQPGATAKLIYTGAETLTGSTTAYINGELFQQGTGTRFYPIGVGSTYMPASFNNVTGLMSVQGFASGATLTLPENISAIASNRYWQLSTESGTLSATNASLFVPGSSIDASLRLVVVQADNANGADAINLQGAVTEDFVTSFSEVTKPVLTLGVSEEVDIRIHDLITPFNEDLVNDQLKILNIEYVFTSKVTLLDRWGVPVNEWKDFRNYDHPTNPNNDGYDFTKLSPGNYICVLEYQLTADSPKEKISQMITVLKGN